MRKFLILITLVFTGFVLSAAANELSDIEMAVLAKDWKRVVQLTDNVRSCPTDASRQARLLYWQALSAMENRSFTKARSIIDENIKNQKVDQRWRERFYLLRIDAYYLDEKYDQALVSAQDFLKVNPKSDFLSLGYLKLARAHLKLAHWVEARQYLNKTISEFPGSMDSQTARQLLEEKDYFSVQIGSFGERDKASQLVSAMKEEGEYAYIIEKADKIGKKLYRVRVGRLGSIIEAQALKDKLSKKGYPTNIFP
ncbi:MAG: SPOR domain-containing protein [Candidatus Omnitrophica bacterium]|nr:SPOR domain-containing protein [Candidatus Omnitrophota bacterium]